MCFSNIYNNLIMSSNSTLYELLLNLEKNKKQYIILRDEKNCVNGTIVDGDIRRLLLKGYLLNDKLKQEDISSFEYLTNKSTFDEVCEKFKSKKIDFLPIVDENMRLINVITKKQFHIMLLENIQFDLKFDFSKFDKQILEHEIYNRPWGFYKSTVLTSHAQSKIITVFPNSELSLQEHKRREEHWVIIKGRGKLVLGDSIQEAYPGKYIFIPKSCKHQVINNSDENLIFVEVQLGEYFGEDDIIRYKDKYGRK